MNGKIQNSPIRPAKTIQPHHIRHIISGTLVFLLGIVANETLMYARRHWPKTVRWSESEIQRDYAMPVCLPPTNVAVEMGITDDGLFVWRPRREGKAL